MLRVDDCRQRLHVHVAVEAHLPRFLCPRVAGEVRGRPPQDLVLVLELLVALAQVAVHGFAAAPGRAVGQESTQPGFRLTSSDYSSQLYPALRVRCAC